MKLPRSPFPYMVVGATLLVASIYLMANIQDAIEEREEERRERQQQAYLERERQKRRQQKLWESQWRQIDYVADETSGAKAYGVYSPTVPIKGLGGMHTNKVTLAIEWSPLVGYELVILRFWQEPKTEAAKFDLSDLTQRVIGLRMVWTRPAWERFVDHPDSLLDNPLTPYPDTSFVQIVQLRFFPKEGRQTLGYMVDKSSQVSRIIHKLRYPYHTLRLEFDDWYLGRKDLHAEINVEAAEYEIDEMRGRVRSVYGR